LIGRRRRSLWLATWPGDSAKAQEINRRAVLLNDLYRQTVGAKHVSDVRFLTAENGLTASVSRLIANLKYPINSELEQKYLSPEAIEDNEFWKLFGVSAVFDNSAIGLSGSAENPSGDVGFLDHNYVVLDTDSGFRFLTDGTPDADQGKVNIDSFFASLPAEVQRAFSGPEGETLKKRSYDYARAVLTNEVIDGVVGSGDPQLAAKLKSRRDDLPGTVALPRPDLESQVSGADYGWANSMRKLKFPDGYEQERTKSRHWV
jgi:hypothetical protein